MLTQERKDDIKGFCLLAVLIAVIVAVNYIATMI